MKLLFLPHVLAISALALPTEAQLIPAERQAAARNAAPRTQLPIDAPLYRFALAMESPTADLALLAKRHQVRFRSDGMVKIEATGRLGMSALDGIFIRNVGGIPNLTWRHRSTFWIPATRLLDLARALPDGYFLEDTSSKVALDGAALPGNAGEVLTGSSTYVAGGDAGQGVSIAVIDVSFAEVSQDQALGLIPAIPVANLIDYTFAGFEEDIGKHGNLCLQTVADHAPAADYYAYKIGNQTEFILACADAASKGIDITSISLGYLGTGWADDTGTSCAGVQIICDGGGLVFNSSGNYADTHWQGVFDEGGTPGSFHDWVPGDELNSVFIGEDATLTISLVWDDSLGTDYDLLLWDNPALSVVESSTNPGTKFEFITYPNPVAGVAVRYITVEKISGPDVEFEIVCGPYVGQLITVEHVIAGSSTYSPMNCTDPNMIVVGAVQWDDYESAPVTAGISTYYSSQGPTNGGAQVPHIVAPTGTDVDNGGSFTGTSCACPNAAGTAAALLSSAPFLSMQGLKDVLLRQAELTKDWGPLGFDTEFGWGGIWLHPWHTDTVWIDRQGFNPFQSSSLPFTRVAAAQSFATEGGRLLFLGGDYPEAVTLDKQLRLETVGPTVTLGE